MSGRSSQQKKARMAVAILLLTIFLSSIWISNFSPTSSVPSEPSTPPESSIQPAQDATTDMVPRYQTLWAAGYWPSPTSFAPYWSDQGQGWDTYMMYEPMFGTNAANGSLIKWLGENIRWIDSTTIEVTLRSGIHWNDSTPITTADVKFTFALLEQEHMIDGLVTRIGDINDTSFEIVSDTALRVHILPAYADSSEVYRQLVHGWLIVPKAVWTVINDTYYNAPSHQMSYFANDWQSSGFPAGWKVASGMYLPFWHDSVTTIMQRNDNWWGVSVFGHGPVPKYFGYTSYNLVEAAALAMEQGNLDWYGGYVANLTSIMVSYPFIHAYFKNPPYLADKSAVLLVPNHNVYPLNQSWLHKAISCVLNYTLISENSTSGYLKTPSPLLIPADDAVARQLVNTTIESKYAITYDVAKGLEILNQYCNKNITTGVWWTKVGPNGEPNIHVPLAKWNQPLNSTSPWQITDINGWTDTNAMDQVAVDAITSKLGIEVNRSLPDWSGYVDSMNYMTFDFVNYCMELTSSSDMFERYSQMFTGPAGAWGHYGNYTNSTLTTLLSQLETAGPGSAAQQNIANQIQEIIGQDMPIIPLAGFADKCFYSDKNWMGWPTEDNPLLPASPYGMGQQEAQLHVILLGLKKTPDATPPATISDLAAVSVSSDLIALSWTAPGDDGNKGTAVGYVVKYSSSGPITASNWDSAATYTQSWTPNKNGTQENHLITGLNQLTQYWFAVKAYDEDLNYGAISNSPSAITGTRKNIIWATGYWTSQWSFNPLLMDDGQGWDTYMMYEPMFGTNVVDNTLMKWLGDSITWTNSTTITIVLRDGIKWTDGSAITTQDIQYTYKLLAQLGKIADLVDRVGPISNSSMEIIDSKTIKVHVNPSYANSSEVYRQLVYGRLIVPKKVWTQINASVLNLYGFTNDWNLASFPGSWKVASGMYLPMWHDIATTVMQRNDNWWGASVFGHGPAPKYFGYTAYSSNEAAISALEQGNLDWYGSYPENLSSIMANYPFIHAYFKNPPYFPDQSATLLVPNHNVYPLNQPWLHKAISCVLNYTAISLNSSGGYLKAPSPLLIPADDAVARQPLNTTIESKYAITYNVAKGLEILDTYCVKDLDGIWWTKDLGPDGRHYPLSKFDKESNKTAGAWTIIDIAGWTDTNSMDKYAADQITTMLNIPMTTLFLDWSDYVSTKYFGDQYIAPTFDFADYVLELGFNSNMYERYAQLFTGPQGAWRHYGNYTNPTLITLIGQLETAPEGSAAQQDIANQIQEIIGQDMPIIPLGGHAEWGTHSDKYWMGWPTEDNPLLPASPYGLSRQEVQLLTIVLGLRGRALNVRTLNSSGSILPSCNVALAGIGSIVSDSNGWANFTGVPSGTLSVSVSWHGSKVNQTSVVVSDSDVTVDVKCHVWVLTIDARTGDGSAFVQPNNMQVYVTLPNGTHVNPSNVNSMTWEVQNGTYWFAVRWRGSWVYGNISLALDTSTKTRVLLCKVYSLSFTFKDSSGGLTINPASWQIKAPNGTALTMAGAGIIGQAQNGTWELVRVPWQGGNVVPAVHPTLSLTGNTVWTQNLRIYNIQLTFRDSSGSLTLPSVTNFTLKYPNGTLSTLSGNPSLYIQNGTNELLSVYWQGSNIVPLTHPTFDATNGDQTFNCRIYRLSATFRDSNGASNLYKNPSQIVLLCPNASSVVVTSYSGIVVQNGSYTVTSITWNGVNVVPSPNPTVSLTDDSNLEIDCLVYDLRIKVTDEFNAAVEGAMISVTLPNGTTITALTGEDGFSSFLKCPCGSFNGTISFLTQKVTIIGDISKEYSFKIETPPVAITDLTTSSPTDTSITLTWTAPGDDGVNGNASGYVVKYSTSGSITDADWDSATTYTQSWTPAKNGTTETHVITGLSNGVTYWFAIKAYDDALPSNYGGVSNSASGTTLTPGWSTNPPIVLVGGPGNNATTPSDTFRNYNFSLTVNGAKDVVITSSREAPPSVGTIPSGTRSFIFLRIDGQFIPGTNLAAVYLFYNRTSIQELGINETSMRLYRWNSTTSLWDEIPGTAIVLNSTHGVVIGYMTHFSYFAVFGSPVTGGGNVWNEAFIIVMLATVGVVVVVAAAVVLVRRRSGQKGHL